MSTLISVTVSGTLWRMQIPASAVRQLRAELRLGQVATARLAGVSERTWRRWERGERPPDPDRLDLVRLRVAEIRHLALLSAVS